MPKSGKGDDSAYHSMMPYCTVEQFELQWGTNNVAVWSNLDGQSAVINTDRCDLAIQWASKRIDDLFRVGRLNTPLTQNVTVQIWCGTIAAHFLAQNRGVLARYTQLAESYAAVMAEIGEYLSNRAMLEQQPPYPQATAPLAIM